MNNTMEYIEKWQPFIKKLSYKYQNTIASQEDLENEGIIGLLKALKEHDPSRAKLNTFIYQCISCSIIIASLKNAHPISYPAGTILSNNKVKESAYNSTMNSVHIESDDDERWSNKDYFEEYLSLLDSINKFDSKDIAKMYFIDGCTCQEIANKLKMSCSQVWKKVDHVREVLRKEIKA